MSRITVIGSMNIDFIVTTPNRPNVGETVIGDSFKTAFGGKGANQAIAAARLGAEVFMIGKVGKDQFGDEAIRNLQSNSVNVDYIEKVNDVSTGSAHITVSDNDNSIIVIPGANNQFENDFVNKFYLQLLESNLVMLQHEIPSAIVEDIITFCYENKINTILNPAPMREVPINIIDKCTYLTPNEIEFKGLFNSNNIKGILKEYPNKLIVTLGSKGVIYHDGQEVVQIPAYPSEVVDTTGAGDAFNGALGFALVSNYSLSKSIRIGNLAASISIGAFGAQEGMPTFDKLKSNANFINIGR